MYAAALGGQLELQEVVTHLMWVPGTELGCSGNEAKTLNHRTISPALTCGLFVVFWIHSPV